MKKECGMNPYFQVLTKYFYMRKFLIIALGIMTLCLSSCKNDKQQVATAVDLNVEKVTVTDKEYMFVNHGGDYRWFESCILLKNYLDEENDGAISEISNVFQVVKEFGKSADVFVVFATHTPDSTSYEVKDGFWVEDYNMSNEEIKISFKEAYDKIMAVNYPKPHSKHCVLRKQVGPVECNPQYIFGNQTAQLYVDAVTGDVTDKNPAFPDAE